MDDMHSLLEKIRAHPVLASLEEGEEAYVKEYIRQTIKVCQIPAPSLEERERAEYVASEFRKAGLEDVEIDEVNNAIGRLRGESSRARLSVSAHLDTVFPRHTDLSVQRDGAVLRCPGIGDNSTAVAALITLARLLRDAGYVPSHDMIFLANAAEEGLGNLAGIRYFFDSYVSRADVDLKGCLIYDGALGFLVNQGVASRRLEVSASTEGGHSWKDFGRTNAIREMAQMITEIYEIEVPSEPRTTYNVGTIQGGTSVNTVAQSARMLVDMRSVSPGELASLARKVGEILEAERSGCQVSQVVRGERPGGTLSPDHPLVRALRELGRDQGLDLVPRASSTDANWPLSLGVPAVTVGLTVGNGTHTLEEWIDTSHSPRGLRWALISLLAAAEVL